MVPNEAVAAAGTELAGIAVASAGELVTTPNGPAPSTVVPAAPVTPTLPLSTDTDAGLMIATMKSVPRTPIVACGVRNEKDARLRPATVPVTIRSAPFTRSSTERSSLAFGEL